MKILVNPDWYGLIKVLSVRQQAEILRCILTFPDQESKISVWDFISKELKRNADKYKARAERLDGVRHLRWLESKQTEILSKQTPVQISDTTKNASAVEVESKAINNKKIEIDKYIASVARGMTVNIPQLYRIDGNLDFFQIPEIAEALPAYDDLKLSRAHRTLIEKRLGQDLTASQILSWIAQEGKYGTGNKKGTVGTFLD